MTDAFREHIVKSFPQILENPVIIACSGGVDSVVLSHLCERCGLDFALAHCNYHLRGEDSDEDQRFTSNLADSLGVRYFTISFDTEAYASAHKLSIQMAARELRYRWFSELLSTQGYSCLLTAHHLDDALETFVINLSRGTGLEGLTGIPAETDKVVRPLLPFTRDEILVFAKEQGIQWREDHSNEETKYLRNKIRHELVPVLRELHPTFQRNFRKTLRFLTHTSAMLSNYIDGLREEIFEPYQDGYRISLNELEDFEPLEAYLYELFKPYGFTSWGDIAGLTNSLSGKEVRSSTHRLIKDREHLILQEFQSKPAESEEREISLDTGDLPLGLKVEQVMEIEEKNNTILYVDKETLNDTLTVRKWQKGDYFYPLGMDGKKKVSKFFKDEKMDAVAKQKQWLLCCGDQIVWIIGRRADDRFKITADTKEILKITTNE
ncbi:tRNA(Ile)-lysidine synthase [Muriicola jejuensis]|uniref:tRNA(Ile)-lysidine synthase n=1 Tax=Muriicola jejuensis TaxID=504488 RepID=A0A6P0UHW1_9FLAO|nr:tRNA lysidine(34) synthetase TilS [Muriicola jejuensis]NER11418.1 tRNA lysidine(34) synthetase TilS [Muriicola jejuensis]SMP20877.1 tRNA(Ile)-lysidine synthase [Muriicola jejuensis]